MGWLKANSKAADISAMDGRFCLDKLVHDFDGVIMLVAVMSWFVYVSTVCVELHAIFCTLKLASFLKMGGII